jgi:hypothetical protein
MFYFNKLIHFERAKVQHFFETANKISKILSCFHQTQHPPDITLFADNQRLFGKNKTAFGRNIL